MRPGAPRAPARSIVSLLVAIAVVLALTVVRVVASGVPEVRPGDLDLRGFRPAQVAAADGAPVRYPCEPIHYVINPGGAPKGGIEDVHQAIELTAAASGLTFVYDGETDEVSTPERNPYQPERYGERWAPVLLGWTRGTPPGAVQATAETHPVAVGGSTFVGNASGRPVYVSGSATFDATVDLRSGFGGETWGQVILHEIGHVVGLGHVDDQGSVMNPVLGLRPAAWGDGDRAGLWSLGIGASCLEPPTP